MIIKARVFDAFRSGGRSPGGLRFTWSLLVCVCLAGLVQAQQARETLKVGYVNVPPLTYEGIDGRAEGVFIELTRQVAREAGYDLDFQILPISRAYAYLRTGGIDVWPGATDVPALENEVLESYVSPFSVRLSLWAMEAAQPVEHFDDLQGKTLILITGYTHGGLDSQLESNPDIKVIRAPHHRAALAMLARGRADYLLDFEDPVRALLQKSPLPGIQEFEVQTRNAAWIFSLANPKSSELRDEFDDAYLRLAERGEVPPPRKLAPTFTLSGLPQ